jgi:hypothetical protein
MEAKIYQCKNKKLSGTSYGAIYPHAMAIFRKIKSKTKRRPYARSAYFKKEKVFLDYFWEHLHQKNMRDKVRRLKFYACAIELIEKSKCEPKVMENPNKKTEILYRFSGKSKERETFTVQIKKDKRKQKFFMSVFSG